MNTNDCFSDLLWMPHSQHKLSKIWENPSNSINIRHHRVGIPYHPLCLSALENLGFYHIVKMKKINVDKYLISALVERWRPETNSFHLPVGEMTVTLQDISCLWGLPIQGKPIVGKTDGSWADLIERLLGIPIEEQHMKHKRRKKEDDTHMYISLTHMVTTLLGKMQGIREIKHAAWGIKCVVSGCKNIGKHVLRMCLANLRDLNLEPRLHNMLREAGLPTQIDDIPSDDDGSAPAQTPRPPSDTSLEVLDDWIYSGRGFSKYLDAGVTNVNGVPTSQDRGQVTQEIVNDDPVARAQQSAATSHDQTVPSELRGALQSFQAVDCTGISFSRRHTGVYAARRIT